MCISPVEGYKLKKYINYIYFSKNMLKSNIYGGLTYERTNYFGKWI